MIFRISAFLGLFPFTFTDKDLIRSRLFTIHCMISPIMLFLNILYTNTILDYFMAVAEIKFNKLVYQGPLIATVLIPTLSFFWLSINLQDASKMFRALRTVENVIRNHPSISSVKEIGWRVAFLLPLCFAEVAWFQNYYYAYFHFLQMWIYLVILQFTSVLAAIRNHYSFLENTLNNSTATEWAQCHEVLGACCEIVNRCYSPQLLIYVLTSFGSASTSVYSIIIAKNYFSFSKPIIIESYWVLSIVAGLWRVVYNCHETVQKVSFHSLVTLNLFIRT